MNRIDQLTGVLRSSGSPLASREITARMQVSQPTLSRLVASAGDRIVRIGRGRATRYALSRDAFRCGPRVPLFTVDEAGLVSQVADLWPLGTGQYFVETSEASPFWLRGQGENGLFDSLPYFLYDLRPSGFIGRQIARALAIDWDVPPDPRNWDDSHIGRFLCERGTDLPGNLAVGAAAARRIHQGRGELTDEAPRNYARLAERALSGRPPGSSAAGEQPKFAICCAETGHVIVKFSSGADTPEATRWRDLLWAEAHALAHLGAQGLPVAQATIFSQEGRVFLESRRFDRRGPRGRVPSISLGMVDAEFAGEGQSWTRVGSALHRRGLLSQADADALTWLETFGEWIGNSDMHLGNVSLGAEADRFTLHPVYDMLPMAFAPVRSELPDVQLRPPLRTTANEAHWAQAGECAAAYWTSLAEVNQLSDGFRSMAEAQGHEWRKLRAGNAR